MTQFKRNVLSNENAKETAAALQESLVQVIDLALLLKQAHWNVVGTNFRAVHLQLDEILVTVRDASDDIAERIATLGIPADGRSATVSKDSQLSEYPESFLDVPKTLEHVGNALKTTVDSLRKGLRVVGETDPISEDLVIGITAALEKHLWMLQAQEA